MATVWDVKAAGPVLEVPVTALRYRMHSMRREAVDPLGDFSCTCRSVTSNITVRKPFGSLFIDRLPTNHSLVDVVVAGLSSAATRQSRRGSKRVCSQTRPAARGQPEGQTRGVKTIGLPKLKCFRY